MRELGEAESSVNKRARVWALAGWGVWMVVCPAVALAQRTVTAEAYLDKLRGMWFGQLIGNHTGAAFEGLYCTREAAPDDSFAWVVKTSAGDPWLGDDDTAFEYLYLHVLETYGLAPTDAQIQWEWEAHVPLAGIYIANLQAKYLMNHGVQVPATGSYRLNMHAYAIDSQITTESLGALSPGQRQWARDAVQRFAGVTNEGFARHAAEFYGTMYAAAGFESDVHTIVALGQGGIPVSSRTWRVVQDVCDWYTADMLDGVPDWRATRRQIYDRYCGGQAHGRYRGWIESTVNVAMTTLALLYGEGDFEQTVRIAVLSGFDADCNAPTAGGLIGLVRGYTNLPTVLTASATDTYRVLNRPGLPQTDTITGVAGRLRGVAEQVIVVNGGIVAGGVYTVPSADVITPEPELPDPAGPTGLVGAVLAAGGSVSVSASLAKHNPNSDRDNLDSIIDGIVDVRHNGHLPYETYDGDNAQPAGGDYYQLNFSAPMRFDRLTFYEGDMRWSSINADPRVLEPYGGYFLELAVEVGDGGSWRPAQNLVLSEPLDPFAYYQVIVLTFDSIPGDAVRIRGTVGGSRQYTSIVELLAEGMRIGDLDGDGPVGSDDFAVLAGCIAGPGVVPTPAPPVTPEQCLAAFDCDNDGDADLYDFGWFARAFGR